MENSGAGVINSETLLCYYRGSIWSRCHREHFWSSSLFFGFWDCPAPEAGNSHGLNDFFSSSYILHYYCSEQWLVHLWYCARVGSLHSIIPNFQGLKKPRLRGSQITSPFIIFQNSHGCSCRYFHCFTRWHGYFTNYCCCSSGVCVIRQDCLLAFETIRGLKVTRFSRPNILIDVLPLCLDLLTAGRKAQSFTTTKPSFT